MIGVGPGTESGSSWGSEHRLLPRFPHHGHPPEAERSARRLSCLRSVQADVLGVEDPAWGNEGDLGANRITRGSRNCPQGGSLQGGPLFSAGVPFLRRTMMWVHAVLSLDRGVEPPTPLWSLHPTVNSSLYHWAQTGKGSGPRSHCDVEAERPREPGGARLGPRTFCCGRLGLTRPDGKLAALGSMGHGGCCSPAYAGSRGLGYLIKEDK